MEFHESETKCMVYVRDLSYLVGRHDRKSFLIFGIVLWPAHFHSFIVVYK